MLPHEGHTGASFHSNEPPPLLCCHKNSCRSRCQYQWDDVAGASLRHRDHTGGGGHSIREDGAGGHITHDACAGGRCTRDAVAGSPLLQVLAHPVQIRTPQCLRKLGLFGFLRLSLKRPNRTATSAPSTTALAPDAVA
jgi:hypothetical protein